MYDFSMDDKQYYLIAGSWMALIKSAYQWSVSGNAATTKVNPAVQAVVLLLSLVTCRSKSKDTI